MRILHWCYALFMLLAMPTIVVMLIADDHVFNNSQIGMLAMMWTVSWLASGVIFWAIYERRQEDKRRKLDRRVLAVLKRGIISN